MAFGCSGKKCIVLFFQVLFGLWCLATAIFSIYQFGSKITTAKGNKLEFPGKSGGDPCSDGVYYQNRPFAFSLDDDPETLSCGWASREMILRLGVSGFASIYTFLLVMAVWKKRTAGLYLSALVLLITFLAFCTSLILDGNAVRASKAWCDDGLAGSAISTNPRPAIHCQYTNFSMMTFFDVFAVLLSGTCTVLTWKYVRHWMNEDGQPDATKVVDPNVKYNVLTELMQSGRSSSSSSLSVTGDNATPANSFDRFGGSARQNSRTSRV
eukprot:TRINITY_DN2304_c0_g2_i1.p1 TRINITY_DN2304_c0_g2~~TRINITY_DN2304_c0_g2_i1.p1  ORF type:complete len:305 (+),score=85.85 TRINITY_DN2304_c0_g2_i1:113-916(+)